MENDTINDRNRQFVAAPRDLDEKNCYECSLFPRFKKFMFQSRHPLCFSTSNRNIRPWPVTFYLLLIS